MDAYVLLFFAGFFLGAVVVIAIMPALRKTTDQQNDSAPAQVMAEQIALIQQNNFLKQMQLESQRMATEFLELEDRKMNVLNGRAVSSNDKLRSDLVYLLSSAMDKSGYDVSPGFNQKLK